MSGYESLSFDQFIEIHRPQLISSDVPERYWGPLFRKLVDEVYDAGDVFQIQMVVSDDDTETSTQELQWRVGVIAEDGISFTDPNHIYLVDHAWTYRLKEARNSLEEVPGLLERMSALMDVPSDSRQSMIDKVLQNMWKFNQTYKFGHFSLGSEESMPVWYIMDELGSRIQHSDKPSFRITPFFYSPRGFAYTIMWPLHSLEEGDEVTRDYVVTTSDPLLREAKLIPWTHNDMKHVDFVQEEPDDSYFTSYKVEESMPCPTTEPPSLPQDRNIRVFCEYDLFSTNLTDPRFEIVDSSEKADVLWYFKTFKNFLQLSESQPNCFVNQFPSEKVLTIKDLLAIVSRRATASSETDPMEPNPKWLPVTFNLQTELPKFVSYFQHREEKGLDNHWICKPWNLSRSLDMQISNDLTEIVRLREAGPKVACKYIEDPVLFYREDVGKVKFDIRYIVLLSSVSPLKLYAYQIFLLRFANKPFSLDELDDYEKHYTVMNYIEEGKKLKQIHYDEFIPEFESQYPNFPWSEIENDIFLIIKEMFEAACSKPAPAGICASPQSRALYGVDMMLSWETKPSGEKCIKPMVCEVNFSPDCERYCKYHPFFVNDVFSVLFLEDIEDKRVVPLS